LIETRKKKFKKGFKIKVQENRLLKQQKEYDEEIKKLNETISRLENHLAEQSKEVAEVSFYNVAFY